MKKTTIRNITKWFSDNGYDRITITYGSASNSKKDSEEDYFWFDKVKDDNKVKRPTINIGNLDEYKDNNYTLACINNGLDKKYEEYMSATFALLHEIGHYYTCDPDGILENIESIFTEFCLFMIEHNFNEDYWYDVYNEAHFEKKATKWAVEYANSHYKETKKLENIFRKELGIKELK